MIINYQTKTIQIKMVYFGPAMSGKTTSLKYLMSKFGKEDTLSSIDTSTGRTLVFDFGTLLITGKEWNLKIILMSATGQDFYASTRPATVEMVDGLFFVVDSQIKYLDDNIRSWNELFLYFGERIYNLPIIICLNKQDLPNTISSTLIIEKFNLSLYKRYEIIPTVASSGKGIVDSFQWLIRHLFPSIALYS